ncbi:MAG: TIGR03087 family PEP-CTERM/XrtA system glycosyltransferase [Candidatus Poribacteria bacterium]|nr:TIGR03087 family PEP-CTERM/XrtA system glycosyltransferase [Candidatus Poribacteria bacterium]
MKILFLSLRFPYPPHRGDRIRAYHFIKQLAQHHSVTVVSFFESDQEVDYVKHLQSFCDRVESVRFHHGRARLNSLLHCLSSCPLQVYYWFVPEMQRAINRLLNQHSYDLIHAQLFRMGQYVPHVRGVPKMLDLCDSLGLNLSRRAALDRSLTRTLVKLEARRVRHYEVEIMNSFDWGTVAASVDRDYLLKQDERLKLSVVPMGVDLDHFQPASNGYRPHILFTGTMDYFPNWDAVQYFHSEIFPLVQEAHPETVFYVVGSSPTSRVRKLANHKSVVVTGRVPDTRPYFDEAAVFVSPMRAGSGLQVKNLEAMAMGVPVVTSSLGAMGLDAKVGESLLVGDTPEAFAKQIIDLIESPDFRQAVGTSGRRLVERKYCWDVLVNQLEGVYSQICH